MCLGRPASAENLDNIQRLIKTRSCRSCDLSKADLRNSDLRNVDLTDANLSQANLSQANLTNALLQGANLQGANLSDANLSSIFIDSKTSGIPEKLSQVKTESPVSILGMDGIFPSNNLLDSISIKLANDGKIYVDTFQISKKQLYDLLRVFREQKPCGSVSLLVFEQTNFGKVSEYLDFFRKIELDQVFVGVLRKNDFEIPKPPALKSMKPFNAEQKSIFPPLPKSKKQCSPMTLGIPPMPPWPKDFLPPNKTVKPSSSTKDQNKLLKIPKHLTFPRIPTFTPLAPFP